MKLRAALLACLIASPAAAQQVSTLPQASTPLNGTEVLYVIQNGVSRQTTVGNLSQGSFAGNVSIGGNLAVAGNSTFSGSATYTGNATFNGATTFNGTLSLTLRSIADLNIVESRNEDQQSRKRGDSINVVRYGVSTPATTQK